MTSGDRNQTRQFIYSFILQGWYFNHRCLTANRGRWRGERRKFQRVGKEVMVTDSGMFSRRGMTMANGVAMNSWWRTRRSGLHVHSVGCQSDLCPRQGPPWRPRPLVLTQAAQMLQMQRRKDVFWPMADGKVRTSALLFWSIFSLPAFGLVKTPPESLFLPTESLTA